MWDELFVSSLSALEVQRAAPVLELFVIAGLTATKKRLVLQGRPRNDAPASAIVGPLGALFEVMRTSAEGPLLHFETKRGVQRSVK
ncbi:MAG: hypothetical protein QM765_13500 [Myxococcales bacterium]